MNHYTTQDYALANWLVFSGLEMIGSVQYPGNTRKSFVFIDSDNLQELVEEWLVPTQEDTKICKAFFKAHTVIKKALKESMDVQ